MLLVIECCCFVFASMSCDGSLCNLLLIGDVFWVCCLLLLCLLFVAVNSLTMSVVAVVCCCCRLMVGVRCCYLSCVVCRRCGCLLSV